MIDLGRAVVPQPLWHALARTAIARQLARRRDSRNVLTQHREELVDFCVRFLHPQKVAIDIGANVGMYTRVLADGSAAVLAVEPYPLNADRLRALGLRNVRVVQAAASDAAGLATLRLPVMHGVANSLAASINPANDFSSWSDVEAIDEIVVECRTVDAMVALWDQHRAVSFIKIDVEGNELSVLRGAQEVIRRDRPVVQVETEARHGADVAGVFSLLEQLGYRAGVLASGSLQPISASAFIDRQRRPGAYVYNAVFTPPRRSE